MEYIQIPVPDDFSFEEIIKRKSKEFIKVNLQYGGIIGGYIGSNERLHNAITKELFFFQSVSDKLIFIVELINHITILKTENSSEERITKFSSNKIIGLKIVADNNEKFDDLLYFLYTLISKQGYTIDKNTFSTNDIDDLNRKINAILIKLDEIQVGNEVIFNEVEELKNNLKEEFESLKSDYPLGKKRWYQRAAGVVVSYAGTKGADQVYEQLKPLIHDFFINHAPHIIDKL